MFNNHSYYSLRYGTLSIKKLIDNAKVCNTNTLILTDINNTGGVLEFVKGCKENNIKPIAGADIRDSNKQLYTLIAKNNTGFMEINKFISFHNINKLKIKDTPTPSKNVVFIYNLDSSKQINKLEENQYIGIKPNEIRKLYSIDKKHFSKFIIQSPVSFEQNDYKLHKHLRAISNNTLLSMLQPSDLGKESDFMINKSNLYNLYKDYPEIIENTERLLDECYIDFDYNTNKNKRVYTDNLYEDKLMLRRLALEGLKARYGNNKEAIARLEHELNIIDKLGFSAYFLINWDIVRYSMSKGFYHVGRGSGANSIVAYCLKITDVDPIELNLYFERFINPKRSSPPDFDIDFSWKDRDEIHNYIFKKYGISNTALLGTINTFKEKSAIRELAKTYGLPKQEIDDLIKYPWKSSNKNDITLEIHRYANKIKDMPNLRSIHAGGVLISEKPISYYTAVDLPPKGLPTTQWDMYIAEDIGFEKLDILSQRGIGHIKDCVEIVDYNRGDKVDIHDINKFKTDEKVKKQLISGETNGCFYIESPAMRGLLKKLKCDNYNTLVAASSIIRPGVAQSGMMKEYINRYHNKNFSYPHPIIKEQLEETFGIMVYQEDVLKVCHKYAGLSLSDADVLRRAMSGKYRSRKEFDSIANKYFSTCQELGRPENITKEIWRQIESFAGYSFSKAHSASYAVESYQSLYLKTYYPLEFMVAVINNYGGFYHTWVYFNEAKRWGGKIYLPCVNKSDKLTNIYNSDIYIGFNHINNLEQKTVKTILEERKNGKYLSLHNFIERTSISIEQVIILIKIGALRFTGKNKPNLLWESHMLVNKKDITIKSKKLFEQPVKKYKLPLEDTSKLEDTYDEIELLNFPVTLTYFDLLQTSYRGDIHSRNLLNYVGKTIKLLGNLVTIKYVWTKKREIMKFGTFTDIHGEFFDTVHFSYSIKHYDFNGIGVYLLLGTVTEEFGYPSITIDKMQRLPIKPDPRN